MQFDIFVSCVFYFMMYSTAKTTQCWWYMNKICEWSNGQTIMTQEEWSSQITTHPSASLTTINPIQNSLESNPGISVKRWQLTSWPMALPLSSLIIQQISYGRQTCLYLRTFIDVSNDPEVRKSPYGWKSMHRIVALCPVNVRTIFAASKSQILSAPVCDPAHTSSSVWPNFTHSTGVEWPLRLWTIKPSCKWTA